MPKRPDISLDASYIPADTDLSRRRIDEVAAKNDIQARATASGRRNEPRTDDPHLDEEQRKLIDESQAFVAAVSRRAGAEVTERANEMRLMSPAPLDTVLEESNIRREVSEAKDRYRDDLDLAYGDRQRKLRDLRGFEEDSGLAPQSAIYNTDTLMFVSLLLALVLGESVSLDLLKSSTQGE
jgi:hypothetical protein